MTSPQKWDLPSCMSLPYAQVLSKYNELHPSFVTLDTKTNQLTMCTEISLHQDKMYKNNKLNPKLSKAMSSMKASTCSATSCKPCGGKGKAKKSLI